MQEISIVTTVSVRGQTVVLAEIRRKLGLEDQSRLLWTVEGDTVRVTPVPDDPIEALWGVFKQPHGEPSLTQDLIQEHQHELADDER